MRLMSSWKWPLWVLGLAIAALGAAGCREQAPSGARLVPVRSLATPPPPASDALPPEESTPPAPPPVADLNGQLRGWKDAHKLPALAAAVVKDGRLVASGAVGTRVAGEDVPVTLGDKFHLGSDTKSITALVAAMLVDEGRLRWDATLREVFPEVFGKGRWRMADITLEQLLSNSSGIAGSEQHLEIYAEVEASPGSLVEQRELVVRKAKEKGLQAAAGEKFIYSNTGFVMAGAMLERVTGKSWEDLVREKIYAPLELGSAGFGMPAALGAKDQPWGHVFGEEGNPAPVPPGPNADNPPFLGPAGTAHMSVEDFARYAASHIGNRRPETPGPPVRPETLAFLHQPRVEAATPQTIKGLVGHPYYALGLAVAEFEWSGGKVLFHGGSNGMNLAYMAVSPEKQLAVVAMTNSAGEPAEAALGEAVAALFREYAQP